MIFDKKFNFSQKLGIFTKKYIFEQNFDLWEKIIFFTKLSIFDQKSIFDQNFDFWQKFRFSSKSFLSPNCVLTLETDFVTYTTPHTADALDYTTFATTQTIEEPIIDLLAALDMCKDRTEAFSDEEISLWTLCKFIMNRFPQHF